MYFNDKYNLELFNEPYIFDDNNLVFMLDENTTTSLFKNMTDDNNLNDITFMNISKTQSTTNTTKRNTNDINTLNPSHIKDNIDNQIKSYEITFDMNLIIDCSKYYYSNLNLVLKGSIKDFTFDVNIYINKDFFQYILQKIYNNLLNARYKKHDLDSNIKIIEELGKKNNPVINNHKIDLRNVVIIILDLDDEFFTFIKIK
jgi:hypothetical protein